MIPTLFFVLVVTLLNTATTLWVLRAINGLRDGIDGRLDELMVERDIVSSARAKAEQRAETEKQANDARLLRIRDESIHDAGMADQRKQDKEGKSTE